MYKKYGLFYNTCKDQKQFNSTLCTACFLFEYHTTMAPPQLLAQKYFFYFKIQHFVQKRQLKKNLKTPQWPITLPQLNLIKPKQDSKEPTLNL